MNPNTEIKRVPIHSEPVHRRKHDAWLTGFEPENQFTRIFQVQESQSPIPLEIDGLYANRNSAPVTHIQNLIERFSENPQPQEKAAYTLISILIHELERAYIDHSNKSDEVFKYVDYNPVYYKDIEQYEFENDIGPWLMDVAMRIQGICFDKRNKKNNTVLQTELLEEALWTNAFMRIEDMLFNTLLNINPEKHTELSQLISRGQPRDSLSFSKKNRFSKTKNARNG